MGRLRKRKQACQPPRVGSDRCMNEISSPLSRAEAEALDQADPLATVREAFQLPDGVIYLDGHSLGPATFAALARVRQAAETEWSHGLIRSWNDAGWIDLPARVGGRIARLIGAQPAEVIVCDSVSVNLFKLASAALNLTGARTFLVEESEFPTDQYIAEGLARVTGTRLVRVGAGAALAALRDERSVLLKSVVNYRSAQVADIAAHEAAALESGGAVVWDLSHATGVLELNLSEAGARFATGCSYKFLNGGPGAPAFVYVRSDVADEVGSPLSGWMGHAAPFAFEPTYAPQRGVGRFATGTPPIISLSALDAALEVFEHLDLALVAGKARRLGDMVVAAARRLGLACISPLDAAQRGGHVSLTHPDGYAVVQALIAEGVIADFRAPDVMRFGLAPLYLRFVDVWNALAQLEAILVSRAWDRPRFKRRAAVT
jgi:kynureninase